MSASQPEGRRGSKVGWLPPLLVGASLAIAAEVAISVLLYGGPGLLRSLTTVLAVESLAFAAGLATSPSDASDIVERVRRRWLLCLLGFLVAALYGTAWSILPWLGSGRLGQGLGLAVLGGLPLYAGAGVLGGIATVARTDPGGRLRGPAAPAAVGVALGFVATGFLLPRAPMPASLLVACLVMLSLGGMAFGIVLGARTEVDVRARRPAPGGEARVEERHRSRDRLAVRVLLHGEHERRVIPLDETGPTPWDVAVVRELMPALEEPWRVLFIGGGASWAPRSVLREHRTAVVDVVERVGAVIELGREYFSTELAVGTSDRLSVYVGNLDDAVSSLTTSYDAVIVDSAALEPLGGETGLSKSTRSRLAELVRREGIIAWGPGAPASGFAAGDAGWSRLDFDPGLTSRVAIYRRAAATDPPHPAPESAGT